LIERLDYLEDSLAALQAREERDAALPWSEVRTEPSHRRTRTKSVSTPKRPERVGVSTIHSGAGSLPQSTHSPTIHGRQER